MRLRGGYAGDGRGARAGVPAITNALGIHPIQLGVLFVVCCETGFLTPPFGANLFITMKITDVKLEEVALRAFPYLLAMWLLIIVVAACPTSSCSCRGS